MITIQTIEDAIKDVRNTNIKFVEKAILAGQTLCIKQGNVIYYHSSMVVEDGIIKYIEIPDFAFECDPPKLEFYNDNLQSNKHRRSWEIREPNVLNSLYNRHSY